MWITGAKKFIWQANLNSDNAARFVRKKLLLFCLLEMVNKDIIRAERDSKVSRRDSVDVTLR